MERIDSILERSLRLIEESARGKSQGVFTGFLDFDKLTNGLQPSELTIIASRPAMGKTSLAISMARNITVKFNKPIGFISLEMFSEKLVTKFIAQETGFSLLKLKRGDLEPHEWEFLNEKTKKLINAPIFIKDSARITISDLIDRCRYMVDNHNVECVFIDYLQLIDPIPSNYKLGNREQEISMIIRVLKQTARELNISIVVLSQLSRAVETRGGVKRPLLSDLRDSGAIEDHADVVCFIYRPEYYGLTEWDDENHTPCDNETELIIAKHRNGTLKNIRLSFNSYTGEFSDLKIIDSDFISSMVDSSNVNPFDDDIEVPF